MRLIVTGSEPFGGAAADASCANVVSRLQRKRAKG